MVRVIPSGSTTSSNCSQNIRSLPSVNEMDLISAVLSGYLDPSIILAPPGEYLPYRRDGLHCFVQVFQSTISH